MSLSLVHMNLIAAPKGTSVNIRKEPTTKSPVLFKRSNQASEGKTPSAGRTTGDFYKDSAGYTWFKITLYKNFDGQSWGWVRNDVVTLFKPKADNISKEKAQSLIDNLVKTDIKVYEKSLLLAPLLDAAEKQGHNVNTLKEKYKGIIQRLDRRQNKIKNSKLVKWQTGVQKATEFLKNGFKSYVARQFGIYGTNGIGSITAIIIGAVIGGGIIATAYFVFRSDYDESTIDLKMTGELEKALSLLTPDEAKKLKADLEKQVDSAARSGYTSAKFGSMFNILKYGALIGLTFWAGTKVLSSVNKAKATKK